MSLGDLLRSFLGLPKFQDFGSEANEFRDPFWDFSGDPAEPWNDDVTSEQEFDVGIFDPRSPFNEPFEMLRRFEEMFQNFGFSDFSGTSESAAQLKSSEEDSGSIREKMLKLPEGSTQSDEKPSVFAKLWDSKGITNSPPELHVDQDLDADVASGKLEQILQPPSKELGIPQQRSFFYNSISIKKVHLPDGRIEEQKVVKDSEGNEEIVVKRIIGDKTHLVKTQSKKGNVTLTEEEYVNMDEKALADFEKKWGKQMKKDGETSSTSSSDSLVVSEQSKESESSYFNFFQKFLGYAP